MLIIVKGHNIFPFALITLKATHASTTQKGELVGVQILKIWGKMNTMI